MNGYEEVPAVSTTGGGEVNVQVTQDGTALRAGVAYANVHTQDRPGGEIRGQFDREGQGQDD